MCHDICYNTWFSTINLYSYEAIVTGYPIILCIICQGVEITKRAPLLKRSLSILSILYFLISTVFSLFFKILNLGTRILFHTSLNATVAIGTTIKFPINCIFKKGIPAT